MLQATALATRGLQGLDARRIGSDRRVQRGIPLPVREQMRRRGLRARASCSNRSGANTAPAVTLAALLATANGDDAILLVMPATM